MERYDSSGNSSDDDDPTVPITSKIYPVYARHHSERNQISPAFITGRNSAVLSFDSDSNYCDPKALLQAVVFVEDAVKFRNIKHKIDPFSLWYYRIYYSWPIQWLLYLAIFTILMLAFFEPPSSLTTHMSSDPRYMGERITPYCGITEAVEMLCLLIFLYDVCTKSYLIGRKELMKSKWLLAYFLVIAFSLVDWLVSVNFNCQIHTLRLRRFLRPFFLIQNSQLMKKTVRSIKNTLPKVASVILLLLIHIYFFTMFGMLLFPRPQMDKPEKDIKNGSSGLLNITINATSSPINNDRIYQEGLQHFSTIGDSLMSLLVLLTTANNPDVTMPAYQNNRFYALYFIIFLGIGLYLFFNMLTAVIYNEFRGYLIRSMQASHFRRRLGFQAAFEMLRAQLHTVNGGSIGRCTVNVSVVKSVVLQANIPVRAKKNILRELDGNIGGVLTSLEFQKLFDCLDYQSEGSEICSPRVINQPRLKRLQSMILHRFFGYFGTLVALVNIIIISVEIETLYDESFYKKNSLLSSVNFSFVLYYCVEQIMKLWAMGWKYYKSSMSNILEGLFTIVLLLVAIVQQAVEKSHMADKHNVIIPVYDLVRIINILIMFRLFKIVTHFKTMEIVLSTMLDLIRNLRAFLGILVVIYYVFAILGMEIFQNKSPKPLNVTSSKPLNCGTYEQLNYYANNFDDFAATLVVLWDVMVVNNWHVFLNAYSGMTNEWSQLYFIAWYFTSVLVCLNVFTAIILENFITSWDRSQQHQQREVDGSDRTATFLMSVHTMFRGDLKEPTEEELLDEIYRHPHIQNLHL
ncbi:two pore channel protein 2-like [Diadema setosum]|uniref:two pore channel protein 2-like n=1 Tax=Diadema setosum TaxID=31175 RepID=UPI003B3A9311